MYFCLYFCRWLLYVNDLWHFSRFSCLSLKQFHHLPHQRFSPMCWDIIKNYSWLIKPSCLSRFHFSSSIRRQRLASIRRLLRVSLVFIRGHRWGICGEIGPGVRWHLVKPPAALFISSCLWRERVMTEGSLLASGSANCPIGRRCIKGQCEDVTLHLHMA